MESSITFRLVTRWSYGKRTLVAEMEFTSLNEGSDFLSYPTNKVLGIVNTAEDLRGAVTELNNAGFGKDQVQVLCGEKGAERLDTTGEHHGFLAKLYRMVENFGDMESKHLREYQAELLAGHFLLAVDVPEENDRARLLDVFKGHDQNGIRLPDAPL